MLMLVAGARRRQRAVEDRHHALYPGSDAPGPSNMPPDATGTIGIQGENLSRSHPCVVLSAVKGCVRGKGRGMGAAELFAHPFNQRTVDIERVIDILH